MFPKGRMFPKSRLCFWRKKFGVIDTVWIIFQPFREWALLWAKAFLRRVLFGFDPGERRVPLQPGRRHPFFLPQVQSLQDVRPDFEVDVKKCKLFFLITGEIRLSSTPKHKKPHVNASQP